MSETFLEAHTMGNYDPSLAIPMYEEELRANPNNIAALNNLGVCQIKTAIDSHDRGLCALGISNIERAIDTANQQGREYPIAVANLSWAREEFENLNN